MTTTTHTEHRIMRRLDGAYDGEWVEWEHRPSGDLASAIIRLAVYAQDRGEFRLEQRQVVTMTEAWGPVE